jgi:ketosteroid isomerase-like protein
MKLVLAAATLILATGATSKPADPAPIVAAERAFAVDGAAMGMGPSFLKHSTADAIMIGGGGVITPKAAFDGPPPDGPQPKLGWWPLWAGIAQSGDFGFTTGPVEVGGQRQGHYFTVWKKQANGGWMWIYDGGANAPSAGEPGERTEPIYLPTSTAKPIAPAQAMSDVRGAEVKLAAAAKADHKAAFAAVLADEAHAYAAGKPAAAGKAAIAEVMTSYPAAMDFGAVAGGEASKAGDMAYAYGPVSWTGGKGMYVHVWQRRVDGWKLVFAQIVPARSA